MKQPERWLLYAKWFVVWAVIMPMIAGRVSTGLPGLLVVALAVGFSAHLVDRMFSFICEHLKR
ncbi:TPA: hypothetical protein N2G35_000925 [Salmonella enterica]|nr:hypothetical protein [Salmonella enterica]